MPLEHFKFTLVVLYSHVLCRFDNSILDVPVDSGKSVHNFLQISVVHDLPINEQLNVRCMCFDFQAFKVIEFFLDNIQKM
jgi:hypothetical protein